MSPAEGATGSAGGAEAAAPPEGGPAAPTPPPGRKTPPVGALAGGGDTHHPNNDGGAPAGGAGGTSRRRGARAAPARANAQAWPGGGGGGGGAEVGAKEEGLAEAAGGDELDWDAGADAGEEGAGEGSQGEASDSDALAGLASLAAFAEDESDQDDGGERGEEQFAGGTGGVDGQGAHQYPSAPPAPAELAALTGLAVVPRASRTKPSGRRPAARDLEALAQELTHGMALPRARKQSAPRARGRSVGRAAKTEASPSGDSGLDMLAMGALEALEQMGTPRAGGTTSGRSRSGTRGSSGAQAAAKRRKLFEDEDGAHALLGLLGGLGGGEAAAEPARPSSARRRQSGSRRPRSGVSKARSGKRMALSAKQIAAAGANDLLATALGAQGVAAGGKKARSSGARRPRGTPSPSSRTQRARASGNRSKTALPINLSAGSFVLEAGDVWSLVPAAGEQAAGLARCLASSAKARRWARAELFYSAVDVPWMHRNHFAEMLEHMELHSVGRLSRAEWRVIRQSMGEPRRFSAAFLAEERAKLEEHRAAARAMAGLVPSGGGGGVPPRTDVPLPASLRVGERVTARHPVTREVHDGSILTTAPDRYRVQFDRPELGVELVMDTDVAVAAAHAHFAAGGGFPFAMHGLGALQPGAHMPAMAAPLMGLGAAYGGGLGAFGLPGALQGILGGAAAAAGLGGIGGVGGAMTAAVGGLADQSQLLRRARELYGANAPEVQALALAAAAAVAAGSGSSGAAVQAAAAAAQAQTREADVRALANMVGVLDKKQRLLEALRQMNDEAAEEDGGEQGAVAGEGGGGAAAAKQGGGRSSDFQAMYAHLLLEMKQCNAEVQEALLSLRERNRATATSGAPAAMPGSTIAWRQQQEAMAGAGNEAAGADIEALAAGPDAMAVLGVGAMGNAGRSGGASSLGAPRPTAMEVAAHARQAAANLVVKAEATVSANPEVAQSQADKKKANAARAGGASGNGAAEANGRGAGAAEGAAAGGGRASAAQEEQWLRDLVSACVATLFMVQTCAESALPRADVVATLDTAMVSLRPHARDNVGDFRELERSVATMKSQLAFTPAVATNGEAPAQATMAATA